MNSWLFRVYWYGVYEYACKAFYSVSNFVGVMWFSGLLWPSKLSQKYIPTLVITQFVEQVITRKIFEPKSLRYGWNENESINPYPWILDKNPNSGNWASVISGQKIQQKFQNSSNEFLCYSFCMYPPMDRFCTWAKHLVNLHKNSNSISKRNENFVEVHARLWFSKIKNNQ